MSEATKSVEEVLREEKADILRRRKVHDQAPPPGMDSHNDENAEELTGLALSGGGVRSAAFCIGFLQRMYTAGRMKAFDYLSTVSGGGYAGALFSSGVAKQTSPVNWDRDATMDRLEFEREQDGTPSERISRLSMHGRMMGNFLRLFSRHLWGQILILCLVASGLVAVGCVLAYFGRLMWNREVMLYLSELKFNTDVSRPFFLTFIALLIWLGSHCFAYVAGMLNRRIPNVTQYTYLLLMVSIVLGTLSILALGDIGITNWVSDPQLQDTITAYAHYVSVGLGGLVTATLLPYFAPQRLMRSGSKEAGPVQALIFNAAGKALVFGAPLLIFYVLVRENISGETENRTDSDSMVMNHMRLPEKFIPLLESQAINDKNEALQHVSMRLLSALRDEPIKALPTSAELQFNDSKKLETKTLAQLLEDRRVDNASIGFFKSWFQGLASLVGVDDAFSKRVERIRDIRELRASLVERVNEDCLSDPFLFLNLLDGSRKSEPLDIATQLGVKVPEQRDAIKSAVETLQSARLQLSSRYLRRDGDISDWGTSIPQSFPRVIFAQASSPSRASRTHRVLTDSKLDDAPETLIRSVESGRQAQTILTGSFLCALQTMLREDDKDFLATFEGGVKSLVEGTVDEDSYSDILGSILQALPKSETESTAEEKQRLVEKKLEELGLQKPKSTNVALQPAKNPMTDGGGNSNALDPMQIHSLVQKYTPEILAEKKRQSNLVDQYVRQIREANWKILHALYPQYIRSQDTTFAYVVNAADQNYRIKIFCTAVLVFLATGFLTNLNSNSIHGVYRDQISEIWLDDPSLKLSDLDTCHWGAPYHLINCTVNRMGHRTDPDIEGKSRWIMSHRFCGTKKLGYRETKQYREGESDVADAIAISGAAVTSASAPTQLHRIILFLTNFRLGQWLPNPHSHLPEFYWPSPIRCLLNSLWYPEQRSHLFVSDGGHLDNSGLASLFERRCKFMICVDAGHDPNYKFTDLMKVLHAARGKYGFRAEAVSISGESMPVDQWLDPLKPNPAGMSESHFIIFKIHYPDRKDPAILVHCKLSITNREPIELVEMSKQHEHFPHEPTSNQFLKPEDFDAYFTLGKSVANEIDEFVCAGGLDQYQLPLGWHSGNDGDPPESEDDESESIEPSPTPISHDSDHESELSGLDFDEVGIPSVIRVLQDDLESESPGSNQVTEWVVSWAKEKGFDATADQRRQFCREVVQLVQKHRSAIRIKQELTDDYIVMLASLGGRSSDVIDTLRSLTSKDSDSQASVQS